MGAGRRGVPSGPRRTLVYDASSDSEPSCARSRRRLPLEGERLGQRTRRHHGRAVVRRGVLRGELRPRRHRRGGGAGRYVDRRWCAPRLRARVEDVRGERGVSGLSTRLATGPLNALTCAAGGDGREPPADGVGDGEHPGARHSDQGGVQDPAPSRHTANLAGGVHEVDGHGRAGRGCRIVTEWWICGGRAVEGDLRRLTHRDRRLRPGEAFEQHHGSGGVRGTGTWARSAVTVSSRPQTRERRVVIDHPAFLVSAGPRPPVSRRGDA